jgi:hypothetical protein
VVGVERDVEPQRAPVLQPRREGHLFEYYKQHLVPTEPPELWDVQVTVDGDVAYVTAEGVLPFTVPDEGSGSALLDAVLPLYERRGDVVLVHFRETTVLRRDDGLGAPAWKIWHFHASPLAPEGEPRPGFGDTARERHADTPRERME